MKARIRSRDGESGEMLVEVLMSLTLMGIIVVSLTGGLFVAVKVSSQVRNELSPSNNVSLNLQTWAAEVQSASYTACQSAAAAPTQAVPAGYTASSTVTYWKQSSSSYVSAAAVGCPASDEGMQLYALTFTSGAETSTWYVIKRRSCTSGC